MDPLLLKKKQMVSSDSIYIKDAINQPYNTQGERILVKPDVIKASHIDIVSRAKAATTPRVYSLNKAKPGNYNKSNELPPTPMGTTRPSQGQRSRCETSRGATPTSHIAPVATSLTRPKPLRVFTDLGCPRSTIFNMLHRHNLIAPLPPLMGPLKPVTFPDRRCAYHQMAGHDTDYCGALKCKIQDLIDAKAIPISNIMSNPLSNHGDGFIEIGNTRVPLEPKIVVATSSSASPSYDDPTIDTHKGQN